ncbi:MAG TPA: hypothetical protein VMV80_05180 [Anaerolineales bacterium]|nr:hypothetical protein [Anaerolineales bacterium]
MSKKIVFAVHAPTDSVEDGLVFGPGVEGNNTMYTLIQVDPKQLLGIASESLVSEDVDGCIWFSQIKETIDKVYEDYVSKREYMCRHEIYLQHKRY